MQARPLLFLGCRLGNDRTVRVLESLAEELRKQKAEDLLEHYAIVERPRNDVEFAARHKRLKQLGILPIWYPTGQHGLIGDLMAHLAAVAGRDPVCGQVPKEPLHYLLREKGLSALRGSLLATDTATVALTGQGGAVGVQGMGGVGKTVLAAALTRDPAVQRAFPDGIFWLTLGQQPNLLGAMNQLAAWLPDCGGLLTSEPEAQSVIRKALDGKRALLILDDVWHIDHAAALKLVSEPGRLLVTTRKREVLVGLGAQEFCVDVLSLPEAVRMLADWAGVNEPALLPPQATDVAQECGHLPLALAMIGAMVQLRPTVWPDTLEFLRSRDLEEFRRAFPDYPYPDLLRAIAVSVEELPPDDHERYLDLAVFPEDEPIPEGPLQVLWGLTPAKTRACMARLAARSLATVPRAGDKTALLLHDLQGAYIGKQREQELPALHARLLDGYAIKSARTQARTSDSATQTSVSWLQGPDDGYYFQRLPWHPHEAKMNDELEKLLASFRWLRAKLQATDPAMVASDFSYVGNNPALGLICDAVRLCSHVIHKDPRQLGSQLLGRLLNWRGKHPTIAVLLREVQEFDDRPCLHPVSSNLIGPNGPLKRVFKGHTGQVRCAAVLDGGSEVVSGAGDGTLRVWDLRTGECLRIFEGHTSLVAAVAVLNGGKQVLSASWDHMLRLWSVETGQCLCILEGHTDCVEAMVMLYDNKYALSGGRDMTLRLWDVEAAQCLRILKGHNGWVTSVMALHGGKQALSWGYDDTLRLWDLRMGRCLRVLRCHRGGVTAVATLDGDRRALSGSRDHTLRLWNLETGQCLRVLEGHTAAVNTVAILDDGKRALSGAEDHTLRMWDLETGQCLRVMHGHKGILAFAVVLDGGRRALSGAHDNTLRLWNLDTGQCMRVMEGHISMPWSVIMLDGGKRALSWSADETLRLWDMETDDRESVREGHTRSRNTAATLTSGINSVAILDDGKRALSGAQDGTLRMWDLDKGQCLHVFETPIQFLGLAEVIVDDTRAFSWGSDYNFYLWNVKTGKRRRVLENQPGCHVSSVVVLRGGKQVLLALIDHTLRLWDLETGRCLRILKGHTDSVEAAAVFDDGKQALSGASDKTIRLWDLETGQCRRVLTGHTNRVTSVVALDGDRRALSGSWDHTLRLWNLGTGQCLRVLEGHTSHVTAVAILDDGKQALSASFDHTLRLWDLETSETLYTLAAEWPVESLAYAPTTRRVVAGDDGGNVHVLQLCRD